MQIKVDLKEFRSEHNLTQTDLALECEVSLETVRRWESGVITPNEENMKKLNEVINKYNK